MADQNKPQDDLSIEEILGSIRRIIAEDDDEKVTPEETAEVVTDPVDPELVGEEIEEEPLELTNKIEPDGSIVDVSEPAVVEPEPVSVPEPEDELVMQDFNDQNSPMQQYSEPEYSEKIILVEEPMPMALQDEETYSNNEALLSSTTAEATTAVMAKLARHTALLQDGAQAGSYGPTVESIVRELLKPMLKTWLDDNLPGMVQKMVEREIERLTKSL